VMWKINLTSDSEYDVYYHTPDISYFKIPDPLIEKYTVKDFHFFITHENRTDEVTLNYKDVKEDWTLLGTYRFSSDTARVELTDKSKGNLVYADAVKFVRR
jgi:hypothetical protein